MTETYVCGFRPVGRPEHTREFSPSTGRFSGAVTGTRWDFQYANFRVTLYAPVSATEVDQVREAWKPHKPRKPASTFDSDLNCAKHALLNERWGA